MLVIYRCALISYLYKVQNDDTERLTSVLFALHQSERIEREDGVSVGTDKAAEAHRSTGQHCTQPCDLWGAMGSVDDSRSAYIRQSKGAGTRLQAGVQ